MNRMTIQNIRRAGPTKLEYDYYVEGPWSKYFAPENPMWAEYQTPVDQVPDSIAVLPLIGNVIVLASLMDAEIYVDEIDRDFFDSIEQFLQGFVAVMPDHIRFKLQNIVHAGKIVENPLSDTDRAENLVFFSGGVDATFSLISHLEEKPALVTIWGADIPWYDETSWKQAISFNQEAADRHGVPLWTIRSNFRCSLHDVNVNDYAVQLVNDWWWPAFHHSIAMMCLAAPLACGRRKTLYFGSSYSSKDLPEWGSYVLASDPKIDNHVRFCGCQVRHDGYECSRFDKIRYICSHYSNQPEKPFLRVCYHADDGKNCGCCEKCALTMMAILLSGGDPTEYGFDYIPEDLPFHFANGLHEKMRNKRKYSFMSQYLDVQTALRAKYPLQEVPPILQPFLSSDLSQLYDFFNISGNICVKQEDASASTVHPNDVSADLEALSGTVEALKKETAALQEQNHNLNARIQEMECSKSWLVTKPLRYISRILRNLKTIKSKCKEKIYYWGLRRIRQAIPEGTWKHDYIKWRWWFICSDQYETRFKHLFAEMLRKYQGELWNRGWLIRFDYWLCWIFLGAEPEDYFDFEYFRKNWKWRNHHITRQRLNFFVPLLNNPEDKHLLDNKAEFYAHWGSYVRRNWCIPQNVTLEEFCNLFGASSRILVKPIGSFGGRGIYTIDLQETSIDHAYESLHTSQDHLIVEEFIHQKGFLNDIYPKALNPIRVTTIMVGTKPEVCYAFFTAGSQGEIVANDCSGGIVYSVDIQTGRMGTGQGRIGNGYTKHPDTGIEVAGQSIPDWEQIKEFVCEAHQLAPEGIHLIGWDVCWSNGIISLIEGNNGPGFPELPNRLDNQWEKIQQYLNRLESTINANC